jgi:hypothetical protein
MAGPERDDFFTLIHKALRAGLLTLNIDAGRLDWNDAGQVEDFTRRWARLASLIRSHAGHEDRHMWPLLESKQKGAVAELGIGHDPIDAELEAADAVLRSVLVEPSATGGLTFYRTLNRLCAHMLEHFSAEEPAVTEVLWAHCTDEELAACRAAFMAEIPSEEAGWTFELILQSSSDDEQRPVVHGLRASMPGPVFEQWLAGVREAVPPDAFEQLSRLLEEPVPVA